MGTIEPLLRGFMLRGMLRPSNDVRAAANDDGPAPSSPGAALGRSALA